MEEQTIKSIHEVFSREPMSLIVGNRIDADRIITEIKEEPISIDGDPYWYYVGYDEKGKKLFEYKKGTVNVHYK